MSGSESNRPDNLQAALAVFAAWLREQAGEKRPDFVQVCANHPELVEELRQLHSLFQLAQAAAHSRSFHQTLREQFGEGAEVTVQLEEGPGIAAPVTDGPAGEQSEAGTPSQTGRYTLEDEVAHGGMGVIWRVRDRDLSRTLAMKVMTGAPGTSAATEATSRINLARFLEEAQVTAQLDHPGIVPVHEVGFDAQGQPFFIMKLVKGRDLNEIFKLARAEQEGWNLPRAVGVVVKACQALAYAHSKGVLHRDLKPANIMVGRFGEVYMMDWGLAKITGRKDLHDIRPQDMQLSSASVHSKRQDDAASTPDSPLITMDGSVVGTPAYMPPEQAQGQVEEVDPLSDVYSLGAILYNLLTGQAPYVAPGARISPHTILGMVIQGPPNPVHQLNPQSPPELIAICEKAMAREKSERYQSSLDLAEDLQAFLDHRVVRAYRTGAVAEFKSWVARNRSTAAVATGAVAIVMSLLLLGALWERGKALKLKDGLARQYLRRGQTLCEQGNIARGLHWLARSMKEAPEHSAALKGAIQQNLANWGEQWKAPRALLLHDSLLLTAALSPDGKRAVTGNQNGVVQFWSVETGEALALTLRPNGAVRIARFSPDGTRLLTKSGQGLRIWNAETGVPVGLQMGLGADIVVATFSPDGSRVVTGSSDGEVQLWNVSSSQPMGPRGAHEKRVNSVAFSPDGRQVLTASDDGTARLWNGQTGEAMGPPMRHRRSVGKALFSPDGARVVTICEDNAARLWSTDKIEPLGTPMVHEGLRAATFSPDGQRLVTGGADKAARLWNAFSGEPMAKPMLHDGVVSTVLFSGGGGQVLTGSSDGTIRFWSAETGDSLGWPFRQEDPVTGVLLSSDGRTLLAKVGDHAVGLWAIQYQNPGGRASLPSLRGNTFAFAPDSRRVLVGGSKGRLWWWSLETGESVRSTIPDHSGIWCVALSPDGKRALTGGGDNMARLCSLDTTERLQRSFVHEGVVRAAVFSPDGKLVATASFDRTARLWSTDTGNQVGPALLHPNIVEDVAFSPDGALVATACGDGAARLWSVKTAQQVGLAMQHRGSVLSVKFSPDGKELVTGSRDKTARFWSAATGRPTGLVLDHRRPVEDVCFSRDGKRLATASPGAGVRIWSTETGEALGPTLEGSQDEWEVAFSPDDTRLVASSNDGAVRLWTFPPRFHRDLPDAELLVQVLTRQAMDNNGVLTWLDQPAWTARRKRLEKLGGTKIQ